MSGCDATCFHVTVPSYGRYVALVVVLWRPALIFICLLLFSVRVRVLRARFLNSVNPEVKTLWYAVRMK